MSTSDNREIRVTMPLDDARILLDGCVTYTVHDAVADSVQLAETGALPHDVATAHLARAEAFAEHAVDHVGNGDMVGAAAIAQVSIAWSRLAQVELARKAVQDASYDVGPVDEAEARRMTERLAQYLDPSS